MAREDDDWFTCPVCGEAVSAGALACPGCGSDDETGWSEDAAYDEADLPGEAFGDAPARPTGQRRAWFVFVAVALAALVLFLSLSGVW